MAELRPNIFPALHYRDPEAALRFLTTAFGASEKDVFRDEQGHIQHAELAIGAGVVMFGGRAATPEAPPEQAAVSLYVVVPDVAAHCATARAAGATITREPGDTSYGSREYAAQDSEGIAWTFGTYDPYAG